MSTSKSQHIGAILTTRVIMLQKKMSHLKGMILESSTDHLGLNVTFLSILGELIQIWLGHICAYVSNEWINWRGAGCWEIGMLFSLLYGWEFEGKSWKLGGKQFFFIRNRWDLQILWKQGSFAFRKTPQISRPRFFLEIHPNVEALLQIQDDREIDREKSACCEICMYYVLILISLGVPC